LPTSPGPQAATLFLSDVRPLATSYGKGAFTDAADSYRAFVSQDRTNEQAPLLEMQAIEAYSKGGFPQLVLQGKKEFVENYSFGTAYWRGRDPKSEPKVVAVLKTNLKDVARTIMRSAAAPKDAVDIKKRRGGYRSYLHLLSGRYGFRAHQLSFGRHAVRRASSTWIRARVREHGLSLWRT